MRPRRQRSAATSSKAKATSDDESASCTNQGSGSGSESEWGGDGGDSPSSSEESYSEPQPKARSSPARKKSAQSNKKATNSKRKEPPGSSSPPKRKRPRANAYLSSDDEEENALPTYARKTDKGGYAHTNKSRARISRANKGNTPWNKEKGWSAEVKARISAGVKARNRSILLVKLKKLGITEEEWIAKKRKIKLLRERVRKKKITAAKYEEELEKLELKKLELAKRKEATIQIPLPPESSSSSEEEQEEEKEVKEEATSEEHQKEAEPAMAIFSREVKWDAHDFDKQEHAYQQNCPVGGPGGLICCEACATAYSGYLTQTTQNMETQTTATLKNEMQEILGFLRDARTELQQAVQTARKKAPPPRPSVAEASAQQKGTNGVASSSGANGVSDHVNWDLTNAMDLGGLGPAAKV